MRILVDDEHRCSEGSWKADRLIDYSCRSVRIGSTLAARAAGIKSRQQARGDDLFHGHLLENTGMPLWWPDFCAAHDLAAGSTLAWLITRRPRRTLPCRHS